MKNEQFKLSNLVLYAKGWYMQTDDIWEDLKKILELDNYTPFDKMDCYSIILTNVQNSGIYRWTELKEIMNGVHPNNCWKYGYYVEENKDWANKNTKINKYDLPTAFIYYTLSNLRFMENNQWKPVIPKFNKYPKNKEITFKKVYNVFVN